MMRQLKIRDSTVIRLALFIYLISLLVISPALLRENIKYFSVFYIILGGLLFFLTKTPLVILKQAWAFWLLILISLIVLFFHLSDSRTIISITTLIGSYLVLYYLILLGIRYIGEVPFEETVFKYLGYILVISVFVSTFLTSISWLGAPVYYPWDAFFTDERLLLVAGTYQGHSNAMWLMAFCTAILIKNTSKGKRTITILLGACLVVLLFLALVETESRTALLFVLFLTFGWAAYFKIIPKTIYAFIPIIFIAVFYLGIVMPSLQSLLTTRLNNIQEAIPSIRITLPERFNNWFTIYAGRDVLTKTLLTSVTDHPWFGSGSSAPILIYGIDRYGNISNSDNIYASTESILRLLVKFGGFYFIAIVVLILTPFIRAIRGYYRDNIFVIIVCGIIIISSINGSIFENLYSISGLFATILILYNLIPKFDREKSLNMNTEI